VVICDRLPKSSGWSALPAPSSGPNDRNRCNADRQGPAPVRRLRRDDGQLAVATMAQVCESSALGDRTEPLAYTLCKQRNQAIVPKRFWHRDDAPHCRGWAMPALGGRASFCPTIISVLCSWLGTPDRMDGNYYTVIISFSTADSTLKSSFPAVHRVHRPCPPRQSEPQTRDAKGGTARGAVPVGPCGQVERLRRHAWAVHGWPRDRQNAWHSACSTAKPPVSLASASGVVTRAAVPETTRCLGRFSG